MAKIKNRAKTINQQIKVWEKRSPIVAKQIRDKMSYFDAMTQKGNLKSKRDYGVARFESWYDNNFGSFTSKMKDLQYKQGIDSVDQAISYLEIKAEYGNKLSEMYARSSEATAVLHRHIRDNSMTYSESKDFLDSWEHKINTKKGREQLGRWQTEQMMN